MKQITQHTRYEFFLENPGPRPPYWEVAYHLWGHGCDFDSDGNSEPDPATPDWTELTVILRPGLEQRVDVDPVRDNEDQIIRPLVLMIYSDDEALARKAARFLHDQCGGNLTKGDVLVSTMTATEVEPGVTEVSMSPIPDELIERFQRSVKV